jgi:hypothetical protein
LTAFRARAGAVFVTARRTALTRRAVLRVAFLAVVRRALLRRPLRTAADLRAAVFFTARRATVFLAALRATFFLRLAYSFFPPGLRRVVRRAFFFAAM